MVSRANSSGRRKPPEERRAEIAAAAAAIALAEGLERVTLRAVAERLGVRPGLIHHYFPAVEQLVAAAFELAVTEERERILVSEGGPLERLAHLAVTVQGEEGAELARLWLNARHLARFSPALAASLDEQETLSREQLGRLIDDGVREGLFAPSDPAEAAVRILIAIDGFGAYANNPDPHASTAFTGFVTDVAEWSLGLEPGVLTAVSA